MTALAALPEIEISSDGRPLDDPMMSGLVQLDVLQQINAPGSCEFEFRDPESRIAATLSVGTKLSVRVGAGRRAIFEGSVAAVELRAGSGQMRTTHVLAYDLLEKLQRGAPVRVHSEVTFADLAEELAQPAGISSSVANAGPLYSRIIQHRRSDLDLLLEVAERVGLCVCLEGTRLISFPIEATAATLSLELGVELREASISRSDVDAAGSIEVRGWDPHEVRAVSGSAPGNGLGTDVKITNVIAHDDGEADTFARSQAQRRETSGTVLNGVAEGDPALSPGTCVAIRGLPTAFSGPFRITRARHSVSPRMGYVVDISSALPRGHAPGQGATATLGVVADARDPRALGRVKVRYPALADAQSDWLQVLAAGAGGKKGFVALPAVDDNVLVLGFDGDPSHGVVLGALYGASGLPGDPQKPIHGYAIYSPGGHVIELDDEGALLLRTSDGTFLELGKKQSTLHVLTDLRIEAPGKTISIAAANVEIERA
jgi:phage baseplate assembly protein V